MFSTNGDVVGYSQSVTVDNYQVLMNGLWYGFSFGVLVMGFWAVKGVWKAFLGGDTQSD